MYEIFEQLLQEKGVSAYRVAKETGISQPTLSDWKRGKSVPKLDKLQKLAAYFGVTVDYLLGKNPDSDDSSGLEQPEDDVSAMLKDPKIKVFFRHLEEIPKKDRDRIIKNFDETIDIYLNRIGRSRED